ncbi:MAG: DUF2333 family protein [Candidatus Competibacteraceae bacterium]
MDNPNTATTSQALADKTKHGVERLAKAYHPRTWKEKGLLWTAGLLLLTYAIVVVVLGILWSITPSVFDVRENALEKAQNNEAKLVPGYVTTATAIRIAETLLQKPGGYLSNDKTPPGVYLDNMPNWEYGVLTELRDTVRALRNDFSRSQTQSVEDRDLAVADPQFNFDSESWILPSTEGEYQKGIKALYRYLERLADDKAFDGQFFTRADNLAVYLEVVRKRLGSFTQRLASSVGHLRLNTNLAGDSNARQSTPTPQQQWVQTPWLQIDDVFYESRGYTWALLHMLKAMAIDFQPVLKDKNAQASLDQVIRELEAASARMWIPIVLNGTGFGLLANHSLVMASYIASANAAISDLVILLRQG